MEIEYVHAKAKVEVKLPERYLKQLPEKVGLVTNIQHLHKLKEVQKQIKGAVIAGQILGCNAVNAKRVEEDVEGFLYIGSGVFHPIQAAIETRKPVWCWDPFTKEFKKLDEKTIKGYENRRKTALKKFILAEKVGVVVSTKIGQRNLKRALELGRRNDKQYYVFVCDNLDMSEMENFNFIQFWINTACPRIPDARTDMININELVKEGLIKFPKIQDIEIPIWMSTKGLAKT